MMQPISLDMKNFFSHRDSYIDFTQFQSALLIGNIEGNYDFSNGSGKSAVFEAILWALFNKSRAASMDDIILWGEETCAVTFIFKHREIMYKVIRTRSRVTSTSFVKFSNENVDGTWQDISGSTSGLTNERIVSTINVDYKTFINSAYFRQNDISEFAESDAARKKEILKSIIDLSKWDNYEKESKAKLKFINNECKALELSMDELEQVQAELISSMKNYDQVNSEICKKVKEIEALESAIEKMSSKQSEIKRDLDTDQWDKVTAEIKKARAQETALINRAVVYERECGNYTKTVGELKLLISQCTSKAAELECVDNADEQMDSIREELIKYKSDVATAQEVLKLLSGRKISQGECYVCKQEITDVLYDKLFHDHEEQKDVHNLKIIYSKNKIIELDGRLQRLDILRGNKRKRDSYIAKIKSSNLELNIAEEHVNKILTEKNNLSQEIINVKNDIMINQKQLESLKDDNFHELHKQIDSAKQKRSLLSSEIQSANREIGVLTEKTANLKAKITMMNDVKKLLIGKRKTIASYEAMTKMLGKNGIQTILLNTVIEDLEKTSNQIISSICNESFSILLETQRIGSDGESIVDTLDLIVRKDGVVQSFESLSGGEQFRISLALRIALSEISSRHGGSELEFLLLDEINSPLDKYGTENLFVNVIKSLEEKYKILVITHNELLKEKFDNIIDVTKINGESTATFIIR